MLHRVLRLSTAKPETFFLWGPRQTGKSSLLRATYPAAPWIDLLKTDEFVRYAQRPSLLRDELRDAAAGTLTVIDEIQKVPALLDEVHWLIENRALAFALCGSSARKVRRGHANLLGGRAVRHELFGLVSAELGHEFDLTRAVNHGVLPRHYLSEHPMRQLRAYVDDYLKEEIAAEGLIRNLPAFSDFLRAAALSDTGLASYATIARECGVSTNGVREYYQILVDTLIGRFLPAYTARPKRRVIQAPKFYFGDVGVVNQLARRGRIEPGSPLYGQALENLIHHELTAYREYRETAWELSYWRLASGTEVDFVLSGPAGLVAIEVKASRRIADSHLRGLRALAADQPSVTRRIVVCDEPKRRNTVDGIEVAPVERFLRDLWDGAI
jgi:predicted AAA+ superfamily ATPase